MTTADWIEAEILACAMLWIWLDPGRLFARLVARMDDFGHGPECYCEVCDQERAERVA